MNLKEIKNIYSKREKDIEDARKDFLDAKPDCAKIKLDSADTASRLLTFAMRRISILILLFSLFVILILWMIPLCSTRIAFELIADNITVTLAKEWPIETEIEEDTDNIFVSDFTYINNIEEITCFDPDISRKFDSDMDFVSLTALGKDMSVKNLKLEDGAELDIHLDNRMTWYIKNSALSGSLYLLSNEIQMDGNLGIITQKTINATRPEQFDFQTVFKGAPITLTIDAKNEWRISGMTIKEISFVKECPREQGSFMSALKEGDLTIMHSGNQHKLKRRDCLKIDEVKNTRRMNISKTDSGLKINFEGSVGKIFVGPVGFEKNLSLSVLEYIYHDKKLKMLIIIISLISPVILNTVIKKWLIG